MSTIASLCDQICEGARLPIKLKIPRYDSDCAKHTIA